MNVKTNVGKTFLNLLNLHFPPHHRMRKLFNKNTVKVSYCSMGNMTNVIQRHNATILNSGNKKATQPCNCRNKKACPLDGKCRSESIRYSLFKIKTLCNKKTSTLDQEKKWGWQNVEI